MDYLRGFEIASDLTVNKLELKEIGIVKLNLLKKFQQPV